MIDYCLLEELTCEGPGESGSYETLWVIPAWAVISTPSPGQIPSLSPVEIVAGSSSTAYTFVVGTVGYREESQNGVAGNYNTINIEGFRNKITPHHLHEIRKLSPGYYIVIHQDANGLIRCHGTKDKPLRFSWTSDTGKRGGDRSGIDWRFSGIATQASPVMDASISPPNQLLLPEAQLKITKLSGCIQVFSIVGSKKSDGTGIDSTTTTVQLEYSVISGPNILYQGLITPNLPANNVSNWTITPGTRTSSDFENQIVNQISSGSGAAPRLDMNELSSTLPTPGSVQVQLRVKEGSLYSPPISRSISLCQVMTGIHDQYHDEFHN